MKKFINNFNNSDSFNNFDEFYFMTQQLCIWVQQLQTCIRDHKHVHFLIWSFFKLVITAMSSQLIDIVSLAEMHLTVSEQSAMTEKSHMSSQFKIIRLIRKLKNLFFLKNTEFYHKFWQEFKLKMSKFLKMTHVTADNTHIAEFINAVKAIISK